jgi:hypothetical protein
VQKRANEQRRYNEEVSTLKAELLNIEKKYMKEVSGLEKQY